MKRFRKRKKTPLWWERGCFHNSMTQQSDTFHAECEAFCKAVDVLADPEIFPDATAREEVLTIKKIRQSIAFRGDAGTLSARGINMRVTAITAKCDAACLTGTFIGALQIDDFLGHGTLGQGQAFDVLQVKTFFTYNPPLGAQNWPENIASSISQSQFSRNGVASPDLMESWDINVSRRLGSREKIARFWWYEVQDTSLPSAASVTLRWSWITSGLWQTAPRR